MNQIMKHNKPKQEEYKGLKSTSSSTQHDPDDKLIAVCDVMGLYQDVWQI